METGKNCERGATNREYRGIDQPRQLAGAKNIQIGNQEVPMHPSRDLFECSSTSKQWLHQEHLLHWRGFSKLNDGDGSNPWVFRASYGRFYAGSSPNGLSFLDPIPAKL